MIEMLRVQFAQTNGIRMGFHEAGPKTHGWPEIAMGE